MLLQQLKLENIRSYTSETINFPSGSTILAGDIGTGKSSILLAIEFALFGTSRADLPAEALLRKGAVNGSIELTFRVESNEVMIKRNLKKDKNSIKQLAGHLIINGIKKELMPVELKAEMVGLLGYPEEFISKNKNYIFRYTIYTPQEEMKLILQENIETRLDVLRKIFNIDKYKTIRDNLQFYLKQMRMKIAELKTRTEPLLEQQDKLKTLIKEQEILNYALVSLKPELDENKQKLAQQKEDLELYEQEQKTFLELKQQQQTQNSLIKEKEIQLKKLSLQLDNLAVPPLKIENVNAEINQLEQQKSEVLTKKSSFQEKINYLQKNIQEYQQEINLLDSSKILEKEQSFHELEQQLGNKEELHLKHTQLEELFNKTIEIISKNRTLLVQSKEIKEKFENLDNCPTCYQQVPPEHKQNVFSQEEEKMFRVGRMLADSEQKKNEISSQKEELKKKIEKLAVQENLAMKIKLELGQLKEKQAKVEQKKSQLKLWAQENNELMLKLSELEKINLEELEIKLIENRKILENLARKQLLDNNVKEVEKEKNEFIQRLREIENNFLGKSDLTIQISEKRKQLSELLEKEKNLSVREMQLKTQSDNLSKQKEELNLILDNLKEQSNQLVRLKELYHWLEAYFLQLTYTIEKQVMINIHHLFNQLFQEWFAILIDDENIYSRLDDSFTPVIEQNGYEVLFNNLSGGEKTSAALAYRLALNRVINDVIHQIKTKDLLILDEPTDGFSSEQLDKVREVLEKLDLKQTIIVSHETKIESFVENVIRVNKEGHTSRVS